MTKKLKWISVSALCVAGLGTAIGAAVYLTTDTKPEEWQNNIDEARIAHYGLDGAQLISYIEDGSYKIAKSDEGEVLLDWKEKEISKQFWVYSYASKEGKTFKLQKGDSLSYLLPGEHNDQFAIGVESTRLNFDSKEDRIAFESDPKANVALGHESVYKTGVVTKLGKYSIDFAIEEFDAVGNVQAPTMSYVSNISSDEVKNLTENWIDESGSSAITTDVVTMPIYKTDENGDPIWNKEHQQFEYDTMTYMGEMAEDGVWFVPGALIVKKVEIPKIMESITTGLQFVGHHIKVEDKLDNIYDFGVLQRYGNEFAIHDKNKDADPDLKITAWW